MVDFYPVIACSMAFFVIAVTLHLHIQLQQHLLCSVLLNLSPSDRWFSRQVKVFDFHAIAESCALTVDTSLSWN